MSIVIKTTVVNHHSYGDIEVQYFIDDNSNLPIIISMGLVNDLHIHAQEVEHQLFDEVRELLSTKLNK